MKYKYIFLGLLFCNLQHSCLSAELEIHDHLNLNGNNTAYNKIKNDYDAFIRKQVDILIGFKDQIPATLETSHVDIEKANSILSNLKIDIQSAIEDLKVKLSEKNIVAKNLEE